MACVTPARSSRGHTLNQSCSFTYPSRESQIVHYCIAVGLLLVLPLSIGIFSYYKIFLKTNQQQHNVVQSPQNRTENGSVTNSVKEININQVLLYVAAGFLCCWIPMWAFTLWFRFSFKTRPRIAALLATFLYYFSASVNSFIYTFTNGTFRKQFQNLLCCHREKAKDLQNVAALINEKEIAKQEGEANVQVLQIFKVSDITSYPPKVEGNVACVMFRRNVHDSSHYNCRISANISEYSKLSEYIPQSYSRSL